nr:probable CCR4-associated factor 1 homolog 11 [Tanacetum cinerariifolium]
MPVIIRSVYSHNLESEFRIIESILDDYPCISMDTEFPGVIFRQTHPHVRHPSPSEHYKLLKKNVDVLKLIQVGLTFTDNDGNLPNLGQTNGDVYIWEFNFRDFDVLRDMHVSDSIELLVKQGVDFRRNNECGIDSVKFSELMMSSGMVCANGDVCWVTFHSGYDFGYLVKLLMGRVLPDELSGFIEVLRCFFGERVYDVKHMMRFCDGVYGGLEKAAQLFGVNREAGKCHQAGSDSLLTWRVFEKIRGRCNGGYARCAGVLFGLDV